MARKLRFAPDGPFVRPGENAEPIDQGAGTPGVVYHRAGFGVDQVLLGAGNPLLLNFTNNAGTGAITQLPWTLTRNRFWEFVLDLMIEETVAAPGGDLIVSITAEDLVTSVRSTLVQQTWPVAPGQLNWPLRVFGIVDATAWTNDRGLVEVSLDGAVTLTSLTTELGMRATQYVP